MVGNRSARRGRPVVLILVATVTIGVRRGERVVVVDMAGRARRSQMKTGKRPTGRAMVKRRGGPGNRIVASGTVRRREWRTRRGVHRIVGALPGAQMAVGVAAIRWLGGQRVAAAYVALRAAGDFAGRRQLVRVGQRKSRCTVIKLAIRPDRDRVARGTGRRAGGEIRCHVVWHVSADCLRAVPGRLMAAHANCGR